MTMMVEIDRTDVDQAVAEITEAIAALPDPGDEPRPNARAQIVATRRRLEDLRTDLGTTRQIAARHEAQFARWRGEGQTTEGAIRDLECDLALVSPETRGPHTEVGAALRVGIAYLRGGEGRGAYVPGAVLGWLSQHRHIEHLVPLPHIAEQLRRVAADLAPARARLDAALRSWATEREPAA